MDHVPSNNSQSLTDINVVLGENGASSFIHNASPSPQVTWFVNTVRLEKSSKDKIEASKNVSLLTVTQCDNTDVDTYCASISNGTECTKQTAERKVVVQPKVEAEKPASEQCCIIGQDVEISWKFSGIEKPRVTWLFNKQLLPDNERFQITETNDGLSILTIRNTELTDKGTYTAKAKNSVGEAEAKTTLDIVGIKPIITNDLDDTLQAIKGKSMIIQLSVTGKPKPDIAWCKGSDELIPSDKIDMTVSTAEDDDTHTLTILNVQPEDQGLYSAKFTNVFWFIKSKECKVTVMKSPVFVSKPTSQKVKQNETAVFETKIDGYPTPKVTWFLNDKPLTGEKGTEIEFTSTTGHAKLSVQNTNLQQHAGLVTCRLENVHGNQEETVCCDIIAAPFIITQLPKEKEILRGKNITLLVVAHGSPRPKAEWFYNNASIAAENTSYDEEKNEYQLSLKEVTAAAHEGTYQVLLKNNYGGIQSTCVLTILEPIKLTKIVPETNVIGLRAGEPFEFSADIEGKEVPKVQLTKDGKEVLFTSVEDTRHIYSIPKVKLEHQGVYKLTAKNKTSTEETNVILFVSNVIPTVDNNHEVYLKSTSRVVIIGKMHQYLYPRLESQENCRAQALIVKLIESAQRPIQHLDRIRIDTKEDSTNGNTLGAFSYGVYYHEHKHICQQWEINRTAGIGQLKYEDTFTLRNCHYTDQYLQEYYDSKRNMYYLTTSKKSTLWQFERLTP